MILIDAQVANVLEPINLASGLCLCWCCASPLDGKPDLAHRLPPEPQGSRADPHNRSVGFILLIIAMINPLDKTQLRRQLRQQRQQISDAARKIAEQHIVQQVITHFSRLLSPACAAYFGTDEEVNLQALFDYCWQQGQPIYSPLVTALDSSMQFQHIQSDTRLTENRFGIKEPDPDQASQIAPQSLSMVFTPLVGFDIQGTRLGMGGGFYDRSFSFKQRQPGAPWLVGCAYELQKVPHLDKAAWDIDLDAIVTEKQVYWISAELKRIAGEK